MLLQQPLAGRITAELIPGKDVTDDAGLAAHCRRTVKTNWHPVGTCRMGRDDDEMAVLDAKLRVRGIENLRVIDASAMPLVPSGNTNAPTMALAIVPWQICSRVRHGQATGRQDSDHYRGCSRHWGCLCGGIRQEGARVVIGDIDLKRAQSTAAAIGDGASAVSLDVTKQESIDAGVSETVRRNGAIDILVNNAAMFDMAPIVEITRESYDKLFAVNVKGTLFMMQAVAKSMIKRGRVERSSTSQARPDGAARPWSQSIVPPRPASFP